MQLFAILTQGEMYTPEQKAVFAWKYNYKTHIIKAGDITGTKIIRIETNLNILNGSAPGKRVLLRLLPALK